jgi:predicted RNA-binding Zn ribbon-like protein
MPATTYAGPLRDEPLAVELHNTIYATGGQNVDALADHRQARAWLEAAALRIPGAAVKGPLPAPGDVAALRDAVRSALRAAADRAPQDQAVLATINRASRRAPRSPAAVWQPGGRPSGLGADFHGASRADIILAGLAEAAIRLLTDPAAADRLRRCEAPGCVLMFARDHPRREWCSGACGNRARQARHYRRHRSP